MEVDAGLLHRDAGVREALRPLGAQPPDLRVDGAETEIGAEGHPPGRRRLDGGAAVRNRRRRTGERVTRVEAGHGVEHQGHVLDRPRHRTVHDERVERQPDGTVRRHAGPRPQTDGRGEARGIADRAAVIAAGGKPHLTCGQGGGRSAGGAARRERRVPRVRRRAEDLVEGLRAGPELGRVRLGHDEGAVGLETLDHVVRPPRHVIREGQGAVGRAHAGDVAEILDGDGQSVEVAGFPRALPFPRLAGEPFGVRPGPVETEGGQRVEHAVRRGNPRLGGVQQVERGRLAARQKVHRVTGGEADEVFAVHGGTVERGDGIARAGRTPARFGVASRRLHPL